MWKKKWSMLIVRSFLVVFFLISMRVYYVKIHKFLNTPPAFVIVNGGSNIQRFNINKMLPLLEAFILSVTPIMNELQLCAMFIAREVLELAFVFDFIVFIKYIHSTV